MSVLVLKNDSILLCAKYLHLASKDNAYYDNINIIGDIMTHNKIDDSFKLDIVHYYNYLKYYNLYTYNCRYNENIKELKKYYENDYDFKNVSSLFDWQITNEDKIKIYIKLKCLNYNIEEINDNHQVKMATHLLKKYIKLLTDKLADEIIASTEEYNNIEWG